VPVLALDATGERCAAAVLIGGRVLAERSRPARRAPSEHIVAVLDEVLRAAGVGRRDVELVVACTGPGGFAGVRCGVAAARGVALGIGAPARGADRFEMLAAWPQASRRALIRLPGPSGRLYLQRLRDGRLIGAPALLAAEDPQVRPEAAEAVLGPDAVAAAGWPALVAAAARAKPARPAPLYLRPPDAVPQARCGQSPSP
jgi:tRNA threonylcarbamoyl adenosine modification protein YeaZ